MGKTATITKASLRSMSLKALAAKTTKAVAKSTRSTVAARKAALRQDLEDFNVDRLLDLEEKMSRFIDLVTLGLGEVEILDDKSKTILMAQFLGKRDISEFTAVVGEKIKEIAFAHMNAELEAAGVEDPEAQNYVVEVPSLGKSFCREGAGHSDPSINEDALRSLLGDIDPAIVDRVFITKEVVVVQRELNLSALMAAVEEDPRLMLAVEESLTPGVLKSARLNVRDL
jgi:hypothetical protein